MTSQLPLILRATLQTGEGRRKALEWIIDSKLMLAEALQRGVEREPEVQAKIAAAREKIIVSEYLTRLAKEKIAVSEAELEEYYTKNREEFKVSEAIRISHILFNIGFFLSTDSTITPSDRLLGRTTAAFQPAGTSDTFPRSLTIGPQVPAGTYFLGVCLDDDSAVAESNEFNNCVAYPQTIQVINADLGNTCRRVRHVEAGPPIRRNGHRRNATGNPSGCEPRHGASGAQRQISGRDGHVRGQAITRS
ncbi:MAG: hypothetical protein L0387_11280 [Acidobacteria bacterium]|nr:hypothetical protein [Acidobacteriota bacterium]MCI0622228.1 hypothetical protein [Acidobacteriota bacterium]MCI0717946.1 hypothetical protein [Acidobacteriota bacterium]